MAATFAGNALPEGARPIAQAYAGHQFGYFTALGDGRAILLGEQITPVAMAGGLLVLVSTLLITIWEDLRRVPAVA